MFERKNEFRGDMCDRHGVVDSSKFRNGESIDIANDCHITEDGKYIVFRFTGFDPNKKPVIKIGMGPSARLIAGCKAIAAWNKHYN